VNDIIVYQYQNSKLSGRFYYALFGTYSAYVIKNARYCFDSTKVPTLFTASLEAYHSKDVSATNFYYQTDIQVHATESDNTGKACKVGILVKLNDDNLLWFYWDLLGASEPSEKNRKVSMVYKINGSYNWRSSKDTVTQAGDPWVGGERYVYIPNGNMGYSNAVIGGGVNTFSVLKQGSTGTFMLNGIPCLQSTHANFAGACTVGVLSQYQSYTAFNGVYITDTTELDNIAIEKGIVNEGITIDGTISDAEWTAGGLNATQETASNGEYFKTKAFLGRSFIYVIGEFATTNYRDNAIVGDGTEEDAEITNSYKTWSNTNVEIRCYHNSGDTSYYRRAYVNSILNSASVSNFSFNVTQENGLNVVTYEIMIPYCTFGYPNSTNSTYLTLAVKPGVIASNDSTLYSNPELGAWWSDSIKHEITGCGIS
ncbi:MAG: hypothetical protein J6C97_01920, partial [Clostridia bacterium]|nr:hypothetical protein [Clostridia bacterium]